VSERFIAAVPLVTSLLSSIAIVVFAGPPRHSGRPPACGQVHLGSAPHAADNAAMPVRRRTLLLASNALLAPALPMMASSARGASSTALVAQPGALALAAAMAEGTTSSERLVRDCLARVAAIDKAGPKIHSVLELNPDAVAIAKSLDAERKAGRVRGPLHGVPVLVKDNIATADRMSTSAGSLALDGVRAPRDAHVVRRLRDAGAVILGKTNLSEWANIRSTR